MPAGDPNFCSGNTYQEHPNIASIIEAGEEPFYVAYQNWESGGAKPDEKAMCFAFKGMHDTIAKKLNDGDGTPNGGVRKSHCKAFNDFLGYACAARTFIADDDFKNFKAAVSKYVLGNELTTADRELLNGALFVRVNFSSTGMDNSQPEHRLYAIPGTVVTRWRFKTDSGVWQIVDGMISDAFEKSGSRMINVSGVVQLRMGTDDQPYYEPIVIGEGMTTKGSRG